MLNSNCNAVNNGDIDSGIYKICCASIVGMGCMKKYRKREIKELIKIVYEFVRTWAFLNK